MDERKPENNFNSNEEILPTNSNGGVNGCLISGFGLFLFVVGVALFFWGAYVESLFLLIIGSLLGTFIAGFFILYPVVRLLFFGRDSVFAAFLTTYVEGIITSKIVKNGGKKRK